MTDIYISFVDDSISIAFYGCAPFISLYSDIAGNTGAEVRCNWDPVCDYYFETDGNGDNPVPVSKNNVEGTIHAFTSTETEGDVKGFVEEFFTDSTVTVVKNAEDIFEITLTGAPSDVLYIDGEQGIKSNCRKVYKV